MSDQVVKSDNGKDEVPDKCMQPCQSVWMSHWTRTSYRSVNDVHNRLSLRSESGEDVHRPKHHPSLGGTDNHLPSMLEWTPSKTETQSKEYHFDPEGITSNPEQQVKSNILLEKNVIAFSAPLKDEFLGSTSRVVTSEFNSGRTPTESFFHRQEYIDQPNSTFFIDQKKMNSNAALLIHNPSTSDNHPRDFVGEHFQKMPNHSDSKLFPIQDRPPEARLCSGSYEPPGIPPSVHDARTMRICTNIDSVKEIFGGPPKFSQTTHHFLFTKKTDVNLSGGGQIFRESTISTKIEGKPMSELLSLSPDFGLNIKQGVKLQTLGSFTDSDGKENIENDHTFGVDLKNESSAETDTMDTDTLRENHLFGVDSSLSNKDIEGPQKSPTSHAAIASDREESRSRLPNVELPDINQEIPVISGVANSADDAERSTSRTQSLDVEHFLSHAEHPTNAKSNACAEGPSGLDPCTRWVKRLKPSASESFAYGTKSSKMGEATSHEKVNRFFGKIPSSCKTSSEPKMDKSYCKERMVTDQTAELLRNAESSSTDSVRKSQDITLSHAWIQRWCHKPASSQKEA
ncbi:hypothetical protein GH714_031829 [Hevea brasiliensis]|uniref:Uncharacterized protein n=1 Tax=Hevea brasiliensis TaxID=3981 RepID=A0A6A6NDS3_HEVBR|nr:hypothetical protein GH714_031829 [Hevea brasiliensis]